MSKCTNAQWVNGSTTTAVQGVLDWEVPRGGWRTAYRANRPSTVVRRRIAYCSR